MSCYFHIRLLMTHFGERASHHRFIIIHYHASAAAAEASGVGTTRRLALHALVLLL